MLWGGELPGGRISPAHPFVTHLPAVHLMSLPAFNRKNPCIARMKHAAMLSKPGSPKDTRHFEIDLCGSGMTFEPGDSLAVLPTNDPQLVEDTLAALRLTGSEPVTDLDNKPASLRDALLSSCAITIPDKKFLQALGGKSPAAAVVLNPLLAPENKPALESHLYGREVIDFLLEFPEAQFEAQEFVATQKKVQVRLYSIASSLKAHPDQVHLTVATVRYTSHGRQRKGVASTFLAERVAAETPIPTFINPGKGFRLPAPEEDTPVIMCGPGTGIAPFRSFVQERRATGARGKAWLFFGEVSRKTDFFYEDEWEQCLKDGVLSRMDTAFSRDQEKKIYVQHKILEAAREFYDWLEQGAIFYVCGDASRMAADVDKALHSIVESAGGKSPEEAAAYVENLRQTKRYRRDVY
jgi:sulfite reductase (NADPH) flavoprotein alpha-component